MAEKRDHGTETRTALQRTELPHGGGSSSPGPCARGTSTRGCCQRQGAQVLQEMVAPKAFLLLAAPTSPPAQHGGLPGTGFQVIVQFQAVLRHLMGAGNFCLAGAEGRRDPSLICRPASLCQAETLGPQAGTCMQT